MSRRAGIRRIGVVTTSYPRWPGDLSGSFVAAHAAWLAGAGFDVEVVAAGTGSGSGSGSDIRIHRVPSPSNLFYTGGAPDALEASPAALLGAAAFAARLTAAVATRAPRWDAVVAHWLAPSALAAAVAAPGRPLLAIAHSGDVHLLVRLGLAVPAALTLLARRARLVFVAADVRDRFCAALPAPIATRIRAASIIQPMGVELARFSAIAARRAAPAAATPGADPRPTLVVLARLVPVKGIEVAVEALRHLARPSRLLIAGDGPLRDALARHAAAIAATTAHHVELLGAVGPDARDRLLEHADVLLAPSIHTATGRTEGTPLAVLEALAAGVPVVASAVGGLAVVPGLHLVPPGEPRALAAAITRAAIGSRRADGEVPPMYSAPDLGDLAWDHVGLRLARHHGLPSQVEPLPVNSEYFSGSA